MPMAATIRCFCQVSCYNRLGPPQIKESLALERSPPYGGCMQTTHGRPQRVFSSIRDFVFGELTGMPPFSGVALLKDAVNFCDTVLLKIFTSRLNCRE